MLSLQKYFDSPLNYPIDVAVVGCLLKYLVDCIVIVVRNGDNRIVQARVDASIDSDLASLLHWRQIFNGILIRFFVTRVDLPFHRPVHDDFARNVAILGNAVLKFIIGDVLRRSLELVDGNRVKESSRMVLVEPTPNGLWKLPVSVNVTEALFALGNSASNPWIGTLNWSTDETNWVRGINWARGAKQFL